MSRSHVAVLFMILFWNICKNGLRFFEYETIQSNMVLRSIKQAGT